jgi:hypothetical protein
VEVGDEDGDLHGCEGLLRFYAEYLMCHRRGWTGGFVVERWFSTVVLLQAALVRCGATPMGM